MASNGTVTIKIVGDARGFTGELGKVEGKLGGFQQKMGGFGVGVAGGLAGAFATGQLVSFGSSMLSLGNQVETYRAKADTVFGDQVGDVKAWADANAGAMGITDDKLLGLTASFGDLLKPMGFTATQAADMSKDVVGLSGALSAWSGGQVDASGAADILAKAMLGERDGLKQLGISISEADVTARLAAKGQQDLTGAALEQAKAVATQDLIFEKSTDAQKAWTDGTFAAQQQQNQLKERMAELQETIAGALLPAFNAAAGFLTGTFLPAMSALADWVSENKEAILAFGIGITAALVPAFIAWAAAAIPAAAATVLAAAPVIALGLAIAGLAYLVITHWDTIKNATLAVWGAVSGAVSGAWEIIKSTVSGAIGFLTDIFLNFTGPGLIIQHFDSIVGFVSELPERITDAASGLWDGLTKSFVSAMNFIIKKWNGLKLEIGGQNVDLPFGQGFEIPTITLNTPNIPTFHDGGTFRSPVPGGEGLALLRDRERVLTPQQSSAMGGGTTVILNGADMGIAGQMEMLTRAIGWSIGENGR